MSGPLPPELVDPRTLVAHKRNYRRHPKAQIEVLRASLRRHGPQPTIVARPSDRVILAGHGVVAAAIAERMPTVLVSWWEATPADAAAYLVADNEIGRLADDDQAALADILSTVADGAGLEGTGWTGTELEDLLRSVSDGTPDTGDADAFTVPARPRSKHGVYELGPHRLAFAESAEAGVAAALDGERAATVLTDVASPYDDERVSTAVCLAGLHAALQATRPGGAWWVAGPSGPDVLPLLEWLHEREIWRQTLVWSQPSRPGHRNLLYGWAPGAAHQWMSDRKQTSVQESDAQDDARPWALSSRLAASLLRHNTTRRDVVLDPFAGWGSTLIGTCIAGGRWRGVVTSAAQADVVRRRWTAWAKAKGVAPGAGAL